MRRARSGACGCARRRSSASWSGSPTSSSSSSASAGTSRRRSCSHFGEPQFSAHGTISTVPASTQSALESGPEFRRPRRRVGGTAAPDQLHRGGRRPGAAALGRGRVASTSPRPLGARDRRDASRRTSTVSTSRSGRSSDSNLPQSSPRHAVSSTRRPGSITAGGSPPGRRALGRRARLGLRAVEVAEERGLFLDGRAHVVCAASDRSSAAAHRPDRARVPGLRPAWRL